MEVTLCEYTAPQVARNASDEPASACGGVSSFGYSGTIAHAVLAFGSGGDREALAFGRDPDPSEALAFGARGAEAAGGGVLGRCSQIDAQPLASASQLRAPLVYRRRAFPWQSPATNHAGKEVGFDAISHSKPQFNADTLNPDMPLVEAGLTSNLAVRLSAELRIRLNANLSPIIAFDYPTTRLLHGHVQALLDVVPDELNGLSELSNCVEGFLRERPDESRNKHDEHSNEDDVQDDTPLEEQIERDAIGLDIGVSIERPLKRGTPATDPQAVLLTGVTGFVGIFLLDQLLQQTHAHIYCLVRAGDEVAAKLRVQDNLMLYDLTSLPLERTTMVVGDLTHFQLGLSDKMYDYLSHKIDAIWHNGVHNDHALDYQRLRGANVKSTAEVLKMAAAGKAKAVHFVSTFATIMRAKAAQTHRTAENDGLPTAAQIADPVLRAASLVSGYSLTKWVSERLVWRAAELGMHVVCHRLGRVYASRRSGAANANDLITRLLVGCVRSGCIPMVEVQGGEPEPGSPVDDVAAAMVALGSDAHRRASYGHTYHTFAFTSPDFNGTLLKLCACEYGLAQVDADLFLEYLQNDHGSALRNLAHEVDASQNNAHLFPKLSNILTSSTLANLGRRLDSRVSDAHAQRQLAFLRRKHILPARDGTLKDPRVAERTRELVAASAKKLASKLGADPEHNDVGTIAQGGPEHGAPLVQGAPAKNYVLQPITPVTKNRIVPEKVVSEGEGIYVVHADGIRYIDACSSLFNLNLGYSNNAVKDAITKQLGKLCFSTAGNFRMSVPLLVCAEKIVKLLEPQGFGRVFFTSGGSDSIEVAIKASRHIWAVRGYLKKTKVCSFEGCFHGLHFGGHSLKGGEYVLYGPFLPGFFQVSMPDFFRMRDVQEGVRQSLEVIKQTLLEEDPSTIAAFFMEPISWSCAQCPPPAFWQGLTAMCKEFDILMVADEVVTGFCRTGPWFHSHVCGADPDLICSAKGITGGMFPFGATILKAKFDSDFSDVPIITGLTNGGNPVGCAAAIATIDEMAKHNISANVQDRGAELKAKLRSVQREEPWIGDVRGTGLLVLVELVMDDGTNAPMEPSLQKMILDNINNVQHMRLRGQVGLEHNCIMLLPPLIVTSAEIDVIVDRVASALLAVRTQTKTRAEDRYWDSASTAGY